MSARTLSELEEKVEQTETRLGKLDDITKIAKAPGNSKANEYMRGMANGLILAQAIMLNQEPNYILPPDNF